MRQRAPVGFDNAMLLGWLPDGRSGQHDGDPLNDRPWSVKGCMFRCAWKSFRAGDAQRKRLLPSSGNPGSGRYRNLSARILIVADFLLVPAQQKVPFSADRALPSPTR